MRLHPRTEKTSSTQNHHNTQKTTKQTTKKTTRSPEFFPPPQLIAAAQIEDVAIAYGYNNLPRSAPNRSAAIGKPLPLNQLSDIVLSECAHAGWTEVMPLGTFVGLR